MVWGSEWHSATMPDGLEGFGAQEETEPEPDTRTDYRLIAFPTNDGIDSEELETQLNAAAAEGFHIHEAYADQPLKGNQRGFLFILVRFE